MKGFSGALTCWEVPWGGAEDWNHKQESQNNHIGKSPLLGFPPPRQVTKGLVEKRCLCCQSNAPRRTIQPLIQFKSWTPSVSFHKSLLFVPLLHPFRSKQKADRAKPDQLRSKHEIQLIFSMDQTQHTLKQVELIIHEDITQGTTEEQSSAMPVMNCTNQPCQQSCTMVHLGTLLLIF